MRHLTSAALAAAFGLAATLGGFTAAAHHPAQAHPGFFSSAPAIAAADEDDRAEIDANAGGSFGENENDNENENDDHGNDGRGDRGDHGNQPCVNPAGHERGWCKHGDRGGNGYTTISGTVIGINDNVASFRLDNGQVISVLDDNGTQLNVGGHYRLRGSFQNNGQFVLGARNNNGSYNNGPYGNQSVSGNIVAVGNGTITLLGVPPVVINVEQALNNNATNGSLSIGRHITAYGYYSGNVFFATSIQ